MFLFLSIPSNELMKRNENKQRNEMNLVVKWSWFNHLIGMGYNFRYVSPTSLHQLFGFKINSFNSQLIRKRSGKGELINELIGLLHAASKQTIPFSPFVERKANAFPATNWERMRMEWRQQENETNLLLSERCWPRGVICFIHYIHKTIYFRDSSIRINLWNAFSVSEWIS